LANPDFKPTFIILLCELKRDPKQFPKKTGPLKGARAAPVRYRGREAWRAVYRLDDRTRTVFVLSLATHDEAYEVATRRMRMRIVQ
jgi:mRNA-degrading endonuclease RelE of RelBE toxin-antitoxin system